MEFHSMCVGEEVFGPVSKEENAAFDKRKFERCMTGEQLGEPVSLMLTSSNLDEGLEIESLSELLTEFMQAMSLTHNCLSVDKKG